MSWHVITSSHSDVKLSIISIPLDLQAATPAVGTQNDVGDDDDDEPPLNENDDDDLDDVDQGEELNTQHLFWLSLTR